MHWRRTVCAALSAAGVLTCPSAVAAISVIDDGQHEVRLPQAAHRIISLAPHATELLYAAGAAQSL
ncbi:MAG: cobalamin-binding protein, partial [Burkholderiales bacterium]|nr:cobalamin-binding protein [Burkholderiales bacterium]